MASSKDLVRLLAVRVVRLELLRDGREVPQAGCITKGGEEYDWGFEEPNSEETVLGSSKLSTDSYREVWLVIAGST